jgi:Ca2+/Na+ antiporter
MNSDHSYQERLYSPRTAALFLLLTLVFALLCAWRVSASRFDTLAVILLCAALVFLFYTLNYRTLVIQITRQSLKLKFGVFTWAEGLDNIESCAIDELPWLLQYGGAGIHFMTVRSRYRASFNFLEYPRVVIALKRRRGLVRDLSFSTRQPEQVIQYLQIFNSNSNNII